MEETYENSETRTKVMEKMKSNIEERLINWSRETPNQEINILKIDHDDIDEITIPGMFF